MEAKRCKRSVFEILFGFWWAQQNRCSNIGGIGLQSVSKRDRDQEGDQVADNTSDHEQRDQQTQIQKDLHGSNSLRLWTDCRKVENDL